MIKQERSITQKRSITNNNNSTLFGDETIHTQHDISFLNQDSNTTTKIDVNNVMRVLQMLPNQSFNEVNAKSFANDSYISQGGSSSAMKNRSFQGTAYAQKGRRNFSQKLKSNTANTMSKDGDFTATEVNSSLDIKTSFMDGLKLKMLKRYNQKQKTASVLMKIGFPQKKSKLNEEIGRIQKDVNGKMDTDNKQFFDLLTETSQSFFKAVNENSARNDKIKKPRTTMTMNQTDYTNNGQSAFGKINLDLSKDQNENADINNGSIMTNNLMPLSQKFSLLNQPAFMMQNNFENKIGTAIGTKSNRVTALIQKRQKTAQEVSKTQDNAENINKNKNQSSSSNLYQPDDQQTQATSKMRPVTSVFNNQFTHDKKSSRNQYTKLDGKNPASHYYTNHSRPMTNMDSNKQSNLQKTIGDQNHNTTLFNESSIDMMQTTYQTLHGAAYGGHSRQSHTIEHSKDNQNKSSLKLDIQDDSLVAAEIDDEISFIQAKQPSVNDQQLISPHRATRVSFKQVRGQRGQQQQFGSGMAENRYSYDIGNGQGVASGAPNSGMLLYETGLKESMNQALLHLNSLLNEAQELISNPSDRFEDKKLMLLKMWKQVVDYVKQSADLNHFETIFLTTKTFGDLFMDTKDLLEALKVYKTIKILCEDFQRYQEKMFIYAQIGYTYRLMNDCDNAVKSFKKMLQLAWQEGNTTMEVQAYDNLSIDYFYMGEIAKANYYNDRIMRGKTENDKSIVKKVSCNLLASRREQRHNVTELLRTGVFVKQKGDMQRLPSPSAVCKGGQFSKAINLLPHYTEAQARGIPPEDEESQKQNYFGATGNQGKENKKKSKQGDSLPSPGGKGPRFIMPELQYLNRKPQYDYLKQDKKIKPAKFRAAMSVQPQTKGVYRQQESLDYKPFDDKRFREIIAYAVQMKETSHTTDDRRNLSHMSAYNMVPLNSLVGGQQSKKIFDGIRRSIDQFRIKFIHTIVAICQKNATGTFGVQEGVQASGNSPCKK